MYGSHPSIFYGIVYFTLALSIPFSIERSAIGDEAAVKFDVPALVGVREIPNLPTHILSATQKTIEVVIPVTSEVQFADRGNLQEFRFNVYWNRNVYPICDYGPKTTTFSEIEGFVSIDTSTEKNATLGLTLNSGYQDLVTGTGRAELGNRNGTKVHYQEVPQYEVLVASGTMNRGTGAFFRFHPSRKETLEGGRELVVAFQVPRSWRGGVLQVECQAKGSRKMLAWNEPFEISRAFILPIYLDGDDQARQSAAEFVRSEQQLRSKWQQFQRASERDLLQQLQAVFVSSNSQSKSAADLPADWVHHLIQSEDRYLNDYRDRLPTSVAEAANQFVEARFGLLELSR